jgi:hypothetical protein
MIQRITAVSADVGAPFELISANPPPITSAPKAMMAQTSEPFRALLQKNRDRERSGLAPLEAWREGSDTTGNVVQAPPTGAPGAQPDGTRINPLQG